MIRRTTARPKIGSVADSAEPGSTDLSPVTDLDSFRRRGLEPQYPPDELLESVKPATAWMTYFVIELPTASAIHPALYDCVEELLVGRRPVLDCQTESLRVACWLESETQATANEEAYAVGQAVVDLLGLSPASIVEHVHRFWTRADGMIDEELPVLIPSL